jgi:drug/metabolite transporter (DMT)-like permease
VTTYLVPPLTIAVGWLLLDETPAVLALAGGVVCLVGVSLSRRRPAEAPAQGPPQRPTGGPTQPPALEPV